MFIEKIKSHCFKILPLVYDESLSYYEVLCKVTSKINELIEANEELNEEFKQFKLSFNVNLFDVVSGILDSWKNDGVFDDIIEQIVIQETGNEIAINRIANFNILTSRYLTGDESADYSYLQGMTTDGNTIVCSQVSVKDGNNDYLKLVKYDSNFNVVMSNIINCNHANSMTYKDGYIYATMYGYVANNRNQYIAKINYSTLEIEETIKPTGITLNTITMIDYDNESEYFYLIYAMHHVNVYNNDFTVKVADYNLEENIYHNLPDAIQDFIIKDSSFYILMYPNTIFRYKKTGELLKVYNINKNNGDYVVGECEGITVFDGKIVLSSAKYSGLNSPEIYCQFFETSFETGTINQLKTSVFNYTVHTIYVDSAYSSNDSTGTQSKPYKCLSQALNNVKPGVYTRINVKGTHYFIGNLFTDKSIEISRWGNVNPTVYGCYIGGSGKVYFNNINFVQNTDYQSSTLLCAIYTSDVTFTNCSFTGNDLSGEHAITAQRSKINLYACKFYNYIDTPIYNCNTSEITLNSINNQTSAATLLHAKYGCVCNTDGHDLIECGNNTNRVNKIAIYQNNIFTGDVSLPGAMKSNLIHPVKLSKADIEINITQSNNRALISAGTFGWQEFSIPVRWNNKCYICTMIINTFDATTGAWKIMHNYTYDIAEGTFIDYDPELTIPFINIYRITFYN